MNPILALIITNVIWGAASPIFKLALTDIPPFTLAFIRFFFAALIFIPFIIPRWQKLSVKDWFSVIVSGFFGITINIAFYFLGLEKTQSINAPIIASSAPVFIYFTSIVFLKESASRRMFWGMIVSFIGVLVIILSPVIISGDWLAGSVVGNAFFLLATLGYVVQTVMNKDLVQRVDIYQLTAIQFLAGAITFFPFMLTEISHWSFSQLNLAGWSGIIFGVFFSSALAYFLFNYSMEKLRAQEAGIFTYIDPVAAIILAAPLVGEYPNRYFFLGSLLVFGGIFLAEKRIHWHPLHRLKMLTNNPILPINN